MKKKVRDKKEEIKKVQEDEVTEKENKDGVVSEVQQVEERMAELCRMKLDEVDTVAKIMGCETMISELSNGLPTLLIASGMNYKNEDRVINCVPMPLIIGNTPFFMLQITAIIASEIKKTRISEVQKLAEELNRNFSFSTFVLYEDELSLRYSMYSHPDSVLDQVSLAKCLEIIINEMDNVLKLTDEIVENNKSIDEIEPIASLV